jgi:DNA-directed RNA polymerase alpha subunit
MIDLNDEPVTVLEAFGCSTPTIFMLEASGVQTMGQLLRRTRADLLGFKNSAVRRTDEVIEAAHRYVERGRLTGQIPRVGVKSCNRAAETL